MVYFVRKPMGWPMLLTMYSAVSREKLWCLGFFSAVVAEFKASTVSLGPFFALAASSRMFSMWWSSSVHCISLESVDGVRGGVLYITIPSWKREFSE